jgi:hypothetical protein
VSVTDPRVEYRERIVRWEGVLARGERVHQLLANLRLAVAATAALVAWFSLAGGSVSPTWLAGPAVAFLALVVAHAKVLQRNERAARARRLYARGLNRLDGRWAGTGPEAARFLDGHAYARDLDLFGPGSLFQLVNTARTEAGEATLADWLRGPASIEEILSRQAAVAELRPRVDFREDLAVLAAEAHVGRTGALVQWATDGAAGLPAWAGLAFAGSALVTTTLVIAGFAGWVGSRWVGAWLLVQTVLALRWRSRVVRVLGRIDTPAYDLGLLVELLERIEREPLASPRLASLSAALGTGGIPASRRIARLRAFVSVVDSTNNQLFRPIAPLLLVRSQAAVAIDRWHATNAPGLLTWLRAIGDLEAIASLATHGFEHPADPFPELTDGPTPQFDAKALAHPLLVESVAVRNDVRLSGAGPQVLVVSGSNMSGKSTFLRAVGMNTVLALAGGPVRAERLALSPLAIGATIRIEDSLLGGQSRFYSEILRLRGIVEVTRGPLPLLFLLDEILQGTNSHDRRIGAGAVITALVDAGAIGLVTTHDLALTELVPALGGRGANVHFEDRIEDGRLLFDYRIRPGVVERSNALALMRAVGLEV